MLFTKYKEIIKLYFAMEEKVKRSTSQDTS